MASRITDPISIIGHGEVAGSGSAKQLPSRRARWVKFKAAIDNAGNVYVAPNSGVTKAAGTDTQTAGWPLDAGQETDWYPIGSTGNLNVWYLIGDNAGDDLLYFLGA